MSSLQSYETIIHCKNCAVCKHPQRFVVEKLLLSNEKIFNIAKRYKMLAVEDINTHWIEHMNKPLDHKTKELLEEEAIVRKNSIVELNKLSDEVKEVMDIIKTKVRSDAGSESEDLSKSVNAFKGMAAVGVSIVKLNNLLTGDTEKNRGSVDLVDALEKIGKLADKQKIRWQDVEVVG